MKQFNAFMENLQVDPDASSMSTLVSLYVGRINEAARQISVKTNVFKDQLSRTDVIDKVEELSKKFKADISDQVIELDKSIVEFKKFTKQGIDKKIRQIKNPRKDKE